MVACWVAGFGMVKLPFGAELEKLGLPSLPLGALGRSASSLLGAKARGICVCLCSMFRCM